MLWIWTTTKDEVLKLIKKEDDFHPTIKLTAKILDSETTFLDTTSYKSKFFYEAGILDVFTHSNLPKNFNIRTSNLATLQELKKAL